MTPGEEAPPGGPPGPERPPERPADGQPWELFERRLAAALPGMAPESFLVLALPSDEAGARSYVQFANWGDDGAHAGLRAEAVGSDNLPSTRPLSPAQEERLESLEWIRPPAGDACRNFFREWPRPAPVAEVARLVVRTLREVYGVAAPDELRFKYAHFEGGPEEASLDLGLRPEEPRPKPREKPLTRPAVGPPAPPALQAIVEDGLRRLLGVQNLVRDADGDYPLPVGSAVIYVRLVDGRPPAVAVFSVVLTNVEESPLVIAALNNINRRIRYGRAFWLARQVVVAMELPAVDLTADQVGFACLQLGSLADHLDDVLQGRFGGTLMFEGRRTRPN